MGAQPDARRGYRRSMSETVHFRTDGPVCVITIDRPEVRNAVDRPTAQQLADAFRRFEADDQLAVAVLTGALVAVGVSLAVAAIHEQATEGRELRPTDI